MSGCFQGVLSEILAALTLLAGVDLVAQQSDAQAAWEAARAAFDHGQPAEALQKLDSILREDNGNLGALVLKGAVLDSQQRYAEAESCYERALKLAPRSPQVLNNAANHFLASGNRNYARELYGKVLAIDPHHQNANLQLARLSVEERHGAQALVYLERLESPTRLDPAVLVLRARALALAGRCAEATALLSNFEAGALRVAAGLTQVECKLYDQAEETFSRALDADPANFEILYNLGLAALEAGHLDRAAGVLETALRQRPQDADCLLALSRVYLKQGRLLDAAALLTQAQKAAPERADVLLLLAQVSFRLQFYEDAAALYSRYLKLKPEDDAGRRERGMALACANQPALALADLEWYLRKHPRDATGFYEMAIAQYFADRSKAAPLLDRAIALDPAMVPAYYTRAMLKLEDKKPREALDDLRYVLQREPENYQVLVHVGRAYLETNDPAQAAGILKHAVALLPDQPLGLIHYRRALEHLGRKAEASEVLNRLKHADSTAEGRRPLAGLIDYLSLSAEQQRARYLETLRKSAAANPSDPRWTIRLGKELLAGGRIEEAQSVFRELQSSALSATALAECGKILVDFDQYDTALVFLKKAVAADPAPDDARLDLSATLFHLQGPHAALSELDKTPAAERKGDYYLLRAQILDSLGDMEGAVGSLNHGMQAAPRRPALYLQAAGFLLKHKLYHEAFDLLQQASRLLPDARELLLAQAITFYLLRRDPDAQSLLASLQVRWPEWNRPYLLSGILLEIALKSAEARESLETAVALGANSPEAYYYLAQAILHAAPDDLESAQNAIKHALALTSTDPYIYLSAGKISLAKKDYDTAINYLLEATRLQPSLIPAHYALRDAYKGSGNEQKSVAELDEIKRIARENPSGDESSFSVLEFLFAVK